MGNTTVQVEALSKRYRIGRKEEMHDTLVSEMLGLVRRPLRNWRNLRNLATFGQHEQDSADIIWALRDVSFELAEGEVLGIIGRNGAGKSTLLKILSRITEPTSGMVRIRGRVSSLLEVGTGFHPELTGRENVYLNGTILGMRKKEVDRKFAEMIDFSGVEKFIDTPVKRYSSGMKVRLAFAVAAHLDPDILIVDEVLAVGDLEFQRKCLGKMQDVTGQGRTVLFVSHNMQAVRQLCPRVILLKDGSILQDGPGDAIVDLYMQETRYEATLEDVATLLETLPADPAIRFCRVALMQDDMVSQVVGNGKPIEIVIEYEVLQATAGLRIYFVLSDTRGTQILRSFAHAEEDLRVVPAGHYISRAMIPADFLAPITYEVGISAVVHNVRRCLPHDIVLKMHVQDTGRLKNAYAVHGTIPFLIAPIIPWSTELT